MKWQMRIGHSLFSEAEGLGQAFEIVEPGPTGREEQDVIGDLQDAQNGKGSTMTWRVETTKGDELVRRARERAKEKGIAFPLALAEIGREDPRLAHEARFETLGLKLKSRTLANGQIIVDFDSAEKLAKLAHARAAEKNIAYSAALSEIIREQPQLALRAREEVMDVKL